MYARLQLTIIPEEEAHTIRTEIKKMEKLKNNLLYRGGTITD